MQSTPNNVATWMMGELEQRDIIYQMEIVSQIGAKFGDAFTYTNDNGNLAIDKVVLKEFKKLHGGNAVWDRHDRSWRLEKKTAER